MDLVLTLLFQSSSSDSSAVNQEVMGWGWVSWTGSNNNNGPSIVESLSKLGGLQQMACAERCLLALSKSGKVYMLYYSSESQVTAHSCALAAPLAQSPR